MYTRDDKNGFMKTVKQVGFVKAKVKLLLDSKKLIGVL